jgi:hypothetical protein
MAAGVSAGRRKLNTEPGLWFIAFLGMYGAYTPFSDKAVHWNVVFIPTACYTIVFRIF